MTLKEYIEELETLYANAYQRRDMAVHKYSVINGVDNRTARKAMYKMDVDEAMSYADLILDNVVPFEGAAG